MAKFCLCAAVGFYLLQLCLAEIALNISCRIAGVFHVEKNHRYSLTREDAIELCKSLNSTLPTWEQIEKAYNLGFETCRYGYIEDKIVVPRHTPHPLCAANNTGIYTLTSNKTTLFDTYCFNSSETREKVCEPVISLYSPWPNNQSIIDIFNADGSRYIGGKIYTERPPVVTDDDNIGGSGSANDSGTTEPSIFRPDSSHYPHHPDDVTSMYDEEGDHDSTRAPGTHDKDSGQDVSEDSHSKTTGKAVSPHHGSHEETTTQHLWNYSVFWPSIDYKEKQQQPPTEGTWDESSEEEEDDDGEEGSGNFYPETFHDWNSGVKEPYSSNTTVVSIKDVKHEDSAHDSLLHGVYSGRDSEVRYSTNDTREDVPPRIVPLGDHEHYSTAVSPSDGFFKQEDSTQHRLDDDYSGLETGLASPTNTYSDVLQPGGLAPSSERESNLETESFHTAVLSNGSSTHEESDQDHSSVDKLGRRSGKDSTNRTIHGVLETLIPPSENDHENESSHKDGDGGKNEDPAQDSLSSVDQPLWGSEEKYPANATKDDILPVFFPTSQSEHEQQQTVTALTSHDGAKHEDTSHDSLLPLDYPRWGTEDLYPTNNTWNDIPHSLAPPNENENGSPHKHITDVMSNDGMKHEDTTQDPLLHGMYPERASEEIPLINASSGIIHPGIIHPTENEHKHESLNTVVVPTGDTNYEESMNDNGWMHGIHHGWDHEDRYPANTSKDDALLGIISPNESKHEHDPETSHTAVVTRDGSKHEDSTPDPHMNGLLPWWNSEEKYSTNTSSDEVLPGILPNNNEHENEQSHTVVVPNGGTDNEDSAQDPLTPKPYPDWDSEERHPGNKSTDILVPGIIFPAENVHEKETSHTAVTHSDDAYHEDSTQQPLSTAHQPGLDNEEKHPTDTSNVVSHNGAKEEDSTRGPVRHDIQLGNEDQYTTKSTETVLYHGIVPRKGHRNKTDHTVVTSNRVKNEESTQDPQLNGLHPEWRNEGKHLVNNTQDDAIPGAYPEISRGSDRHPSSPTASGSGESQVEIENERSQPRKAHIPDWLIVVASLLALALILGVCIAVNSRRRCGQKQKLVINNGKGAIDDKNTGGLNGEASKSQEMVHLVHKEKPENQTGPHDEFLAIDETQNQQDMALKTGV
ncbi:CD44 antigen isoform X3 [Hemicordylus capensis]|uniref:CD44 antigen isoform X3 n=1 Tax=Hemicordylus capensis TaxID=884348 RepID=UPI0023022FE3|nr:CD44 antigen isoform X3 [Hemicordylus capensis]